MRPKMQMSLNKIYSRVLSMPTLSFRRAAWLAFLTGAIALAACNQPDAGSGQRHAPAGETPASTPEPGKKENTEK